MMNLLFRLDTDAPQEYVDRWERIINIAQRGQCANKFISEAWVGVASGLNLRVLDRCEGGIEIDDDGVKSIRFIWNPSHISYIGKNELLMHVEQDSSDEWTQDQLFYLIEKFDEAMLMDDGVRGFIIYLGNWTAGRYTTIVGRN
jgi:hypothetical protein